ncbi:MAG: GTP cyclohydrolase [Bacteroidetes bacterium]|nr:GTP cyclohydrolase [Bacteroidota bacterium]
MNKLNSIKKLAIYTMLVGVITISGCKDDEAPAPENEEEVITDVKLIFTNNANANDVVEAMAQDPDGEGVQELTVLDSINLDTGKTYTLTFEIINNLETPGGDIGKEILNENDAHQFFFAFTNNAFVNPAGDGNVDKASDPLNYNDYDKNGNPVGLSTTWTTSSVPLSGGFFTLRLQHQPDIKSSTTGANDGDTDLLLQFVLNIK